MSKFIDFDNTLVNSKHIICLFPDIREENLSNKYVDITYLIVLRLDNNSTIYWEFNNKSDRDIEYNNLKIKLIDE